MTSAEITLKEEQLDHIKNTIEKMNKTQHIEILRIFKQNPHIKLNENRNGIYINLSYLSQESIEKLTQYIEYVDEQERNLEKMESQKEEYKSTFFLNTHE
jgi:ACT domain-containing protein